MTLFWVLRRGVCEIGTPSSKESWPGLEVMISQVGTPLQSTRSLQSAPWPIDDNMTKLSELLPKADVRPRI